MTVAAVTALATAAVVFTPRMIDAGAIDHRPIAATSPANQQIIDRLAAILGQSAEVIAVHPRRAGGGVAEIVLRLDNLHASDRVLPEEVAVLTHSRILQTVTLFTRHDGASDDDGAGTRDSGPPDRPDRASVGGTFERSALRERRFCDAWRKDEAVRPRIVAAGISDMRVETVSDEGKGRRLMQITLTWSPDSADGPDEASALVDIRMPGADEQEY